MTPPSVRAQKAIVLSIVAATALTFLKVIVGSLTGSVAVISEAVHSLTDLIAAGIAWYSLRRASHPPDRRHRYGHEKAEDFSAIAEGAIIVAATAFVVFSAVRKLIDGGDVAEPGLATVVMLVSSCVSLALGLHLRSVADQTESPAVKADSQNVLADVYTSAAVTVGLGVVTVTGWERLDPLIALFVSGVVLRLGVQLMIGSARVLLDESLPPDEVSRIRGVLTEPRHGVTGYHRLRTRRAGSRRYVDLHLTMEDTLTLDQAHSIADQIELQITNALPNCEVLIHIEPASEEPRPGEDTGPSDRR